MSDSIFPIRVKKKTFYAWVGVMLVLGVIAVALILISNQEVQQNQPSVSLMIGNQAPDFMLPTLDGEMVSLSQFQGQPVLVNFWASWCLPCRQEMPEFVRIYTESKAEGLVILGVNLTQVDSLPETQAFVEEFEIQFPVLLDGDGVVKSLYRVIGIPVSIFVRRDGIVTRIQIGVVTAEQINQYVSEIMK